MSILMAAMPPHERPRERLLARGAEALADRELIALVLRNGAPDTRARSTSRESSSPTTAAWSDLRRRARRSWRPSVASASRRRLHSWRHFT